MNQNQVTPRYFCLNELTGTGPFQGHPPIIPVSRQTMHVWVRSGKWPKPLRMNRTSRWPVEQVRQALKQLEADRKTAARQERPNASNVEP